MKNLLKDKKVMIGGVVVLGLIAFYYSKGKKVLANQTPNSYSNADGSFSSTLQNSNLSNRLGANLNIGNNSFQANSLGELATVNSNALGQASSRQEILQQSLAQFQANSLGAMATATPIVTSSGIKVLPSGILQPSGLNGVITTIQTGILGAVPIRLVQEVQVQVENKIKNQKR